ncbi:MAG: glycosyltransferase family 4 protein [Dehalococcoidales bacterium]
MNIVLISGGWLRIPPQTGGGVEAHLFNLAKQISELGHNIFIIDRKYSQDDPQHEIINGVNIIRLKQGLLRGLPYTLKFFLFQIIWAFKVNKWLKLNQSDVIYLCVPIFGVCLFLLNANLKKKTVYGSHIIRRTKMKYGLIDKIAIYIENKVIKASKLTVIANEIIAAKIVQQVAVPAGKVRIVPAGIDLQEYKPGYDATEIIKKYRLENKAVILFVGRVCAEKGVEYLIKAANIFINTYKRNNAHFLIVGPVKYFDTLNKAADGYTVKLKQMISGFNLESHVTFTGVIPLEDKIMLYSACDTVVVPSLVDLDPVVQLEAMASGKPVIGTDIGTMPWRIQNNKSGFIVRLGDEQELADRIEYLLQNPSEKIKMGAYARRNVEENYSTQKMALKMLEVFRDALL